MRLLAVVLLLAPDVGPPRPPPARIVGEFISADARGGFAFVAVRKEGGAEEGLRCSVYRGDRRVGTVILRKLLVSASEIRIWLWHAEPEAPTRLEEFRKGDAVALLR